MSERIPKKETLESSEMTLEEAFASLEEVMTHLESRETSLEASFQLYQDGMKLLKECSAKIDRVEKKVQIMNEEGDLDEFQ